MTRVDTAREAGLYFRGGPQKKQLDGNTGLDGVRSSSANKLYLGGTNTSRRRHKNVKSVLFFRVNRTFRVCVFCCLHGRNQRPAPAAHLAKDPQSRSWRSGMR